MSSWFSAPENNLKIFKDCLLSDTFIPTITAIVLVLTGVVLKAFVCPWKSYFCNLIVGKTTPCFLFLLWLNLTNFLHKKIKNLRSYWLGV